MRLQQYLVLDEAQARGDGVLVLRFCACVLVWGKCERKRERECVCVCACVCVCVCVCVCLSVCMFSSRGDMLGLERELCVAHVACCAGWGGIGASSLPTTQRARLDGRDYRRRESTPHRAAPRPLPPAPQAIKSSHSLRWKVLLSFSCRNRLLLTGARAPAAAGARPLAQRPGSTPAAAPSRTGGPPTFLLTLETASRPRPPLPSHQLSTPPSRHADPEQPDRAVGAAALHHAAALRQPGLVPGVVQQGARGFRVLGLQGFGVQGLAFQGWFSRVGARGLGFRVQGSMSRG
jgi:hypothetical protein